jgi:hypothetical protein
MAHRRKRSVSFDPELDDRVAAAAAAEGVTVSAWLARCAEDRLINSEGLRALAEYEMVFGPLSDEEVAAADRVIDGAGAAAAEAYGKLHTRRRGAV